MIVCTLFVLTLCAIHFTRKFIRKRMIVAAALGVVLYLTLIAWAYLVFGLDAIDIGLTRESTMESLREAKAYTTPHSLPAYRAILLVLAVTAVTFMATLAHWFVRITKAVICDTKDHATVEKDSETPRRLAPKRINITGLEILRLECRMNC